MTTNNNNTKINKTGRKNNTKLEVKWLDSCFTIRGEEDSKIKNLLDFNKIFKEITLRTKVEAAKKSGKIVEIGTIHFGKGRPKKVYALAPASKDIIDYALHTGVDLHDKYKTVSVATISAQPTPINKDVHTNNNSSVNVHKNIPHAVGSTH